jgi:4-coumarate--CoA ligase
VRLILLLSEDAQTEEAGSMRIHHSPFSDVEIPEVAVTPFVMRHAERLADKPAFVDGTSGRTLTYGALDDLIHRLAGGLAGEGFAKGGVLALMAPNMPEYPVVFHAVATLGGVVTTINPTYTAGEVAHQLADSGATVLVTIPQFLDVAHQAAAASGVEDIIVLGDADGGRPLAELLAAEPVFQVDVDPHSDVVVMPYSSGTTGLSKGVMLTHRNLVANVVQADAAVGLAEEDVIVAVLPFFHIYGMQVLMNGILASGGTAVTLPRFDLEQFLQSLQDHRVTRAYVVPPIVLALAKHPVVDRYDLSALDLVFSGAAPLGADLASEAKARIGAEVVQGYGLTETSPVTHATPRGQYRAGSIGIVIPNTEVRVVDPVSGEDLEVAEDGEIWIRGPQVMKGYLNNEEATAATIDPEGWLHSGDIGHVDEDGHFYIVDRLKELIKYKGFQVAPAELEALLLTHPAVADAAVIGVPDDEAGEIPKAFVVIRPECQVTGDQLMAFVAENVASFKRVRELDVVDAIPKSASGKILRRVLRDQERERAG